MITIERAKSWYTGADSVHDFEHILRVYRLSERMSHEEGANFEIVGPAVLLHDAEGNISNKLNKRSEHHEAAAIFAFEILSEEGWKNEAIKAVQHCIRAHRFRSTEKPNTIEAKVVFDADKLDAIGAVGAARAIAYSALHKKPFFQIPSNKFIEKYELDDKELYSSYHEYLYKLVNIKDRLYTKSGRKIARERHRYLESFYDQLLAEYKGEK